MSFLPFSGAYSFGDQQRFKEEKNLDQPGPGQYKTISQLKQNCVSFTKSEKFLNKQNQVPPVGNYKIQYKQIQKDIKAKTMLKKPKSQVIISNLGPGSYNIQKDNIIAITHTFGYKFGSQVQNEQNDSQQKYEIKENISITRSRSQNSTFSKQQRILVSNQINKNPGPGHYNHDKQKINPQISFTVGQRPNIIDQKKKLTPGPGEYEIDKGIKPNQVSKATCFFGNRYDVSNQQQEFPSPSKYYPQIQPQDLPISFKQSRRRSIIDENQIPGPAHYEVKTLDKKGQVSIGKYKRNFQYNNDVPGPGHYEIQSKAIEGYQTSIMFKHEQVSQQQLVPGPGMYNLNNQSYNKNVFIGTSNHLNNIDVHYKSKLGPGQYNFQDKPNGPSFSIRQKIPLKDKQLQDPNLEIPNTIGFIPNYLLKDRSQSIQTQK